jgi:hypothetical protein
MHNEQTHPNIFHIHLDTQTPSIALHEKFHSELNFFAHHFSGHPAGRQHFEPTSHSSIKLFSKEDFERVWMAAVSLVEKETEVVGYMEGEFIPIDVAIPFKPVANFFPPHFSIERRTLSGAAGEEFRETEFHLVLDFDNSDQRVIDSLMDAGLYGALLNKEGYRAIVLTIQGHTRFIKPLIQEVRWYLGAVGGVRHCTIKEEVALKNQRFNMSVEALPEIINAIAYRKTW